MTVSLPIAPEANALLNLRPPALLMAMLLDRQVPLEGAFSAPADLVLRLGRDPGIEELVGCRPGSLVAVVSDRRAPHRFPKAMAARVHCAVPCPHRPVRRRRRAGTGMSGFVPGREKMVSAESPMFGRATERRSSTYAWISPQIGWRHGRETRETRRDR